MILLGKVKIHEIAKKINLTSKEVLERATELKIDAKNHLSSIEEAEAEKIENVTRNLSVVGYEGENVTGYANMFLSQVLGYKKEDIGEHSWEGQDSLAVSDIFQEMRMARKLSYWLKRR